jgi:hypothetical protein
MGADKMANGNAFDASCKEGAKHNAKDIVTIPVGS